MHESDVHHVYTHTRVNETATRLTRISPFLLQDVKRALSDFGIEVLRGVRPEISGEFNEQACESLFCFVGQRSSGGDGKERHPAEGNCNTDG